MPAPKKPKDYQQLNDQLNSLLDWFETGDVNFDEAAAKYQEALELINQMEEYLKTAENKIKKISAKFED